MGNDNEAREYTDAEFLEVVANGWDNSHIPVLKQAADRMLAIAAALSSAPTVVGLHWERDHGDRESASLYGWRFETVSEKYPSGTAWHVAVRHGDCDDWEIITGKHASPEQAKVEAGEWVMRETSGVRSAPGAVELGPLRTLVDAVYAEFCSPDTESIEPNDSKVSYPEERCHITFGMIREARRTIRRAERRPIDQQPSAQFVNHGDSEAQHIADSERLNCPACGGSGHVGDVQPAAPQDSSIEKAWGRFQLAVDGLPPPGIHAAVHYAAFLRREAFKISQPTKAGAIKNAAVMIDVLLAEINRLHRELAEAAPQAGYTAHDMADAAAGGFRAGGCGACSDGCIGRDGGCHVAEHSLPLDGKSDADWVLVPREPEMEQVRAGTLGGLLTPNQASACYQAMVIAAPSRTGGDGGGHG